MGNGPLLGMRDSVWEAEGWDPLWGSGVRVCWGLQEGKRVGVSKGQQQGRGEKLQVGSLMKGRSIYPCFLGDVCMYGLGVLKCLYGVIRGAIGVGKRRS